ncbi:MAG: DUF1523 family protein [Pseudomonadota bacterium]
MKYLRWTIRIFLFALVAGFLYYTLPQRDIVRVNGTNEIRTDFTGWNRIFYAQADGGNNNAVTNRDVRFINAQTAEGRTRVYRNEDTNFGWPPYFKVNSQDLQADAQAAQRIDDAWFVVRHYGIRNQIFSIYPNALSIRQVEGPDVRLIPYFNIGVLLVLFAIYWGVSVRLRRFKERRIDPLFDGE